MKEISIDQTRTIDRLLAAFIFFTRLPFWRLRQPPKEAYTSVVEYWPLTGWLTGGITAVTIWFASLVLPIYVAIMVAIAVRMLLTGALHEDGLADFMDGFGGGGSDRERILTIMKDSHVGTYGVIGLIVYFVLLVGSLASLDPAIAAITIAAGDPFAKMVASQLIQMMPYARREEEAKTKTVYRKISVWASVSLAIQGLLPVGVFIWICGVRWDLVLFLPALVMYFLYLFIWRRLRGYTGDCCGAVCLLVELSFYLLIASINYSTPL